EDSSDLKCQLHFAKEESALMCKKLTKVAKENDSMKEELVKYRLMYGDLDSSLSIEELANSPHSREAELKHHLKLVEEEANLLSHRIVELEVENRGVRAEMDEMKIHDQDLISQESRFSFPPGESGDNFVELRRHLQFVEEEAELLRRSLMELEDQNKLLMNELNKYKSDHDLDITLSEDSCSVISEPSQEELTTAKLQIGELSGKVKKLQYENRVLLSNLQRYDLASCQSTRPLMETDAEAGDSAECIPSPLWREGPIGGESDSTDSKDRMGNGNLKSPDVCNTSPSRLLKTKELETLLGIRAQAGLVSKAIEVLTSDSNGFTSGIKLCADNDCADLLLTAAVDNSQVPSDSKLVSAIFARLAVLQQELNCFIRKVDGLGDCCKEQMDSLSLLSDSMSPDTSKESPRREHSSDLQIKDLQLVLSDANETMKSLQEQLTQERQLRQEGEAACGQKITQLKEDQQKLLLRREFELQSLNLQRRLEQKFWSQEKNLLVQETYQFKQSFLLLSMKLKWFLKRWRQGKVLESEGDDFLEVNSVKELYMLRRGGVEPVAGDNKTSEEETAAKYGECPALASRVGGDGLDTVQHGADRVPPDLKAALERETHQHLLAESYSAVMDLTKQLQVNEKNWTQEKEELVGRFQEEQKQAEQQIKELQNKLKQKEADPWVRRPERTSGCWKEALNDNMQDKDIDCDTEPTGTSLKRTKSVSSISEFESLLDSSPYLPGDTSPISGEDTRGVLPSSPVVHNSPVASDNQKCCTYGNNKKSLSEHLAKDNLGISSWDYTMVNTVKNMDPWEKQIQRSYTAPDKTGIRIYYSPPVVRRLDIPLVQSKEGKVLVEPGFLFTMAKPAEPEKSGRLSDNTYNRWPCNFSKQERDLLDTEAVKDSPSSVPGFPPSLGDFEISGNMSDDMKEITNCVRQAIRSGSLERKPKSASSQTVGLSSVEVQTVQMVSVGLQTDIPRASLHTKSWSPRGSSLLSTRSKHISTSLDKVHSRVDRPCCSPKFGSPKLQRRSSSKLDGSKDRSLWNLHQNKQNGSAWARSTTTRDSPVLSTINDGSSSLFNLVDHAGSTESLCKTGLPESKNKADAPKYGIVQEFLRNVCGRAAQSASTAAEKRDMDDSSRRPDNHDHCSSFTCHSSYKVSKLLSKKIQRQQCNDDQKTPPPSQGGKDGNPKDADVLLSTANEDYACDCTSQPLASCFSSTYTRPPHSKCQHHSDAPLPEDRAGAACD
ncbi:hypothetical protein FKM82_023914, partial [Ascaphus truei]